MPQWPQESGCVVCADEAACQLLRRAFMPLVPTYALVHGLTRWLAQWGVSYNGLTVSLYSCADLPRCAGGAAAGAGEERGKGGPDVSGCERYQKSVENREHAG
jgi:hypothetical protein